MSVQESNVVSLRPEQDRFEEFWSVMPKRVDKLLTKAKWDAITGPGLTTRTLDRDSGTYVTITLKATPEEIIAGAWRYRAEQVDGKQCRTDADNKNLVLKDGGQFTCRPATWLNRGRWLDE